MSQKTKEITTKPTVEAKAEVPTVEGAIIQVLSNYLEQEVGNKVSQYSVQGLMQILLISVAKVKSGDKPEK